MTRGRYNNPDDYGLAQQFAALEKRVQRLETVGVADELWSIHSEADWNTPPENITSGTFATIKRLYPTTPRPGIEILVRYTTGASTALEFKVLEPTTAVNISGTLTSSQNTTGFLTIRARMSTGSSLAGPIELQARRSTGASTARFMIVYAIGGDYQPNGV